MIRRARRARNLKKNDFKQKKARKNTGRKRKESKKIRRNKLNTTTKNR